MDYKTKVLSLVTNLNGARGELHGIKVMGNDIVITVNSSVQVNAFIGTLKCMYADEHADDNKTTSETGRSPTNSQHEIKYEATNQQQQGSDNDGKGSQSSQEVKVALQQNGTPNCETPRPSTSQQATTSTSTNNISRGPVVKMERVLSRKRHAWDGFKSNMYWCRCGSSYETGARLKRHLIYMRNRRCHKCSACQRLLSTKSSLIKHLQRKHHLMDNNQLVRTCSYCKEKFQTDQAFEDHLQTKHDQTPKFQSLPDSSVVELEEEEVPANPVRT